MKSLIVAAMLTVAAPAGAQVAGTVGGAGAQVETGQSAPAGKCERGATVDGERCVCRRVPVESSSRMSLRNVCMTPKQWRVWDRER